MNGRYVPHGDASTSKAKIPNTTYPLPATPFPPSLPPTSPPGVLSTCYVTPMSHLNSTRSRRCRGCNLGIEKPRGQADRSTRPCRAACCSAGTCTPDAINTITESRRRRCRQRRARAVVAVAATVVAIGRVAAHCEQATRSQRGPRRPARPRNTVCTTTCCYRSWLGRRVAATELTEQQPRTRTVEKVRPPAWPRSVPRCWRRHPGASASTPPLSTRARTTDSQDVVTCTATNVPRGIARPARKKWVNADSATSRRSTRREA